MSPVLVHTNCQTSPSSFFFFFFFEIHKHNLKKWCFIFRLISGVQFQLHPTEIIIRLRQNSSKTLMSDCRCHALVSTYSYIATEIMIKKHVTSFRRSNYQTMICLDKMRVIGVVKPDLSVII